MQAYPGSPSSANPFSLFSLPLSPRDQFEQTGYVAENFKFGTSSASSSPSKSYRDSDEDSNRSRSNSIVSLISSVASSKSRSGSVISLFDFSSRRGSSPQTWEEDSDDHTSHAPFLCEAKRSSSRYLTIPGLSRSFRSGPKSKQD